MVSTPITSNKIITPRDNSNNANNTNNNKVNMMSQYQSFVQCVDPESTGSPQNSSDFIELYNLVAGNDLLVANDLFSLDTQNYDFSPDSSMTTPSLMLGGISTPQDLDDSPLFHPFMSSPSLDPAVGFFPDLNNDHNASTTSTRSLMQLSSVPSVTIPVDDTPLSTISPALSPALNIPWSDVTNDNVHSSSTSPSILSNFSNVNSPVISSTTVSSASTSPILTTNSLRARNRKRSVNEMEKDSHPMADELAMKRAKNTDAARRSRLRKVKRMESLEKEVTILKSENIELQTRIAVLESEKKGLEDKNAEKKVRVKMFEQHFTKEN
jgi:hypothetical protein